MLTFVRIVTRVMSFVVVLQDRREGLALRPRFYGMYGHLEQRRDTEYLVSGQWSAVSIITHTVMYSSNVYYSNIYSIVYYSTIVLHTILCIVFYVYVIWDLVYTCTHI